MNISDSQRIATKLEKLGYKSAPEKDADLVVVNACSVRQHAVDRIWGGIKKWRSAGKVILISGCVLPADQKKFEARGLQFFNIKNLENLKNILRQSSNIQLNNIISSRNKIKDYFDIKQKLSGKIAYIPIMTGCDNFCSYCAVPYTRGREVSRPLADILVEVKEALNKGYEEVWLLGQNANSYRNKKLKAKCLKKVENKDFIKLLETVDSLKGDFKFNFMSSNPHDMGPDLIECFAGLKKWTRELHLPLQSGDDVILKKMNRKYTVKKYLQLVSNLKLKIKNLKLSTDVIVGFPTETKTQFENTLKVCKKVGFWKVFIGQYSPRPGTVSAKMVDDVPTTEKKRRWQELDNLINKSGARSNRAPSD